VGDDALRVSDVWKVTKPNDNFVGGVRERRQTE
jgi:hypothetical protein